MELDFSTIILLIGASIGTGVLAGMLGIGGGLIMVPLLQYIFLHLNMDIDIAMRMAPATSVLIIAITSVTNARLQYKNGNVDMDAVKRIAPFLVIGTMIGSNITTHIDGHIVYKIFYTAIFLISMHMLIGPKKSVRKEKPTQSMFRYAGVFIGAFSSTLGVGTTTTGVPLFTLLMNFDIRKAIGTVTVMNLIASVPSSMVYIYNGLDVEIDMPYTFGYVNLLVVIIMIPMLALFIPVGIKIAKGLSQPTLKKIFAIFLLFLSIRAFLS